MKCISFGWSNNLFLPKNKILHFRPTVRNLICLVFELREFWYFFYFFNFSFRLGKVIKAQENQRNHRGNPPFWPLGSEPSHMAEPTVRPTSGNFLVPIQASIYRWSLSKRWLASVARGLGTRQLKIRPFRLQKPPEAGGATCVALGWPQNFFFGLWPLFGLPWTH